MSTFHRDPRSTVTDEQRNYAITQLSNPVIVKELETIPIVDVMSFYNERIHQTRIEDRNVLFLQLANRYYDVAYHYHPLRNTLYYRNKVTGVLFDEWVVKDMFKQLFERFEQQLKQKGFATSLDEVIYLNDRGITCNVNHHPQQQEENLMFQQQQPMMQQQQPMMQQHQPMMQQQPMQMQQQPMMQQQQPMVQQQQQFHPRMMTPNGEVVHFMYVAQNGQPVYMTEQQAWHFHQQRAAQQVPMQQTQVAQAIGNGNGAGPFNNRAPVQQPSIQGQAQQQQSIEGMPACFAFGRQEYHPKKPAAKPQNQNPNPTPRGSSLFRQREMEPEQVQQPRAQQQPQPQPQPQNQDQNRTHTTADGFIQLKVVDMDDESFFNPFAPAKPIVREPQVMVGAGAQQFPNDPNRGVGYQNTATAFATGMPDQAYLNQVFNNVLCSNRRLEFLREHFHVLFGNLVSALAMYPANNTFIRMLNGKLTNDCESADCVNMTHLYLARIAATGGYRDAGVAQNDAVDLVAWYIKSYTSRHCGSRDRARDLYECRNQPLNSEMIAEMDARFERFNFNNQNLIKHVIQEWFYDHNQYVADTLEFQHNRRREQQARDEIAQSNHQHRMQVNAQAQAEAEARKLREEQEFREQQERSDLVMKQLRAGFSDDLEQIKAKRDNSEHIERLKRENDERFDEMMASSISLDEVPQTSAPDYVLVDDIVWIAANKCNHYLPTVNPYQEKMEFRKYSNGVVRYCIMQMSDEECEKIRKQVIAKAARVGDVITEESLDQNTYPKFVVQNGTTELVDNGELDVDEVTLDGIGDSIDTRVTLLLSEVEKEEPKRVFVYGDDGALESCELEDEDEFVAIRNDHVYVTKTRACVRTNDGDKMVFSTCQKLKTFKELGKFINTILDGNAQRASKQAADLVNTLATERINEFVKYEMALNFEIEDFASESEELLDDIERKIDKRARTLLEQNQHNIIKSLYSSDIERESIVESLGIEDPSDANIIGVAQLNSVSVVNLSEAQLGLINQPAGRVQMVTHYKLLDLAKNIFAHNEERKRQYRSKTNQELHIARTILVTKENARFHINRLVNEPGNGDVYFVCRMD